MNLPSPIILQLAIRSLLTKMLQKSILLLLTEQQNEGQRELISNHSGYSIEALLHSIPIKLTKNKTSIEYTSAIALKLSQWFDMSAVELATAIATQLSQHIKSTDLKNVHPPLEGLCANFTISTNLSGWIYLYLHPQGVALWLQQLTDLALEWEQAFDEDQDYQESKSSFSDSLDLFIIQYTHARCCSLLQSAHQAKVIELLPEPGLPPVAQPVIKAPRPLPWLDPERGLSLHHPAEQRLITQFVTILDVLSEFPDLKMQSRLWQPCRVQTISFKLASDLSYAFQAFYAACPIWGETKIKCLALAQARLGLVSITQVILKFLLREGIGSLAPTVL